MHVTTTARHSFEPKDCEASHSPGQLVLLTVRDEALCARLIVGESTARNLLTALLHAFRGEIDLSTLDPADALAVLSGLDRSTHGVHETLTGWADRAEAEQMERDCEVTP
jgi:hypothetical protein